MGILATIHKRLRAYLEIGSVSKSLRLLAPYIARYAEIYAVLFVLLLVSIGITLFFTWFLQNITDAVMMHDYSRVKQLVLYGILFVALSSIIAYVNTYLESLAVVKVRTDLKNHLYSHMLRLPSGYYTKHHSGEAVSHLTNDINSIDGAIGSNLMNLLRLPLITAAAFIYLLETNVELALLCSAVGPVALLSGAIFGKLIRRRSRQIYDSLGKLNSFLNDSFAGQAIIRSFTLEKLMYKKYSDKNQDLVQLEVKVAKLRGWFQVGGNVIGSVTYMGSLCIGAYFVLENRITIGELLAFVNLTHYVISPLSALASLWGSFQRSLAAVERVQAVLEERTETRELSANQPAEKLEHGLEMRNVSLSYENNKQALANISLSVPAGKVIALVGPSGAGKSSLFNLVMGFYPSQTGEILIDSQPVSSMSYAALRNYTAYVPQESYLFSGTIRENIAYGRPDATELEMIRAAKDANASEFILSLPDGYDTEIGERGTMLSGGQKQRIAIARALLKNAPILLLDEATSALDSETELLVQEALERLMKGRTTMVIAHRLSTIHHADVIVVLDQGRIVEQGNHEQLMANKGLYAKLYHLQFGEADSKEDGLLRKLGS